jgi:hypothetical protein
MQLTVTSGTATAEVSLHAIPLAQHLEEAMFARRFRRRRTSPSIPIALLLVALLAASPHTTASECDKIDCSCKVRVWGVEFANPICKIPCESTKASCKLAEKAVKETGNAFQDIEVLLRTGKCGGDICDALEATKVFTIGSVQSTGSNIEKFARRLGEGKPIDALWHLVTDNLNSSNDNLAEAARRSSLLRSTGQIAAAAYGGPAGASAYAAWLTYNETKDLNLALRTGVITGLSSWASGGVADIGAKEASDIALRSVLTGAIAGVAVAASGGDQQQIEQAVVRGAVSLLVREGYKDLTSHALDRKSLQGSTGDGYCLGANPDSGLSCLPPKDAYIRVNGKVSFRNGRPEIDYRKLSPIRPRVGTAALDGRSPSLGISERSAPMTFVSRLPGWNAMAVAHDQFDVSTNPETNPTIEIAYRVGTIPPFVILTYEGAGGGVADQIRAAALKRRESQVQQTPAANPTASTTNASASTAALVEITDLTCKKGSDTKTFVMYYASDGQSVVDKRSRVCRIDQSLGTVWHSLWRARHEAHTCTQRLSRIVERQSSMGYSCSAQVGVLATDDPSALGQ